MKTIADHWNEIEASTALTPAQRQLTDFSPAQCLFHAGYTAAMKDIAAASLESSGNREVLTKLLLLLVTKCRAFAEEKSIGRP